MVRQLYKTLIISILCGSLSSMSMTAFAQEASAGSSSGGMVRATPSNAVQRDSNGVYSKTEKHTFDKIEDSDMLASITMLATGVIGGRMAASYRPITTDVMIAAAGGAAFIAGEVMSNMAFKKKMEDMTAEITRKSDGKIDQAQIQRLEDLKKSYQEAKKTTGTKKMLQLAAAATFAAAAATAVYLAFQEDAMDAACTGAIATAKTGLASCASASATGVGASEGAACGECIPHLANYFATYKVIDVKAKVPAPSLAKDAQIKPLEAKIKIPPCPEAAGATAKAIMSGVQSACAPALSFKMMMQTASATPGKAVNNDSKILNNILFGGQRKIAYDYSKWQSNESNSTLYKILDLMFPKAEASWLPLLGLGAGALASFFLISGSLGVAIDTQMYVPTNRAIAFGVLAGLSYMASNSSQSQMDKMDKNIAKIDAILKDLNALQNGIKMNTIQEQQVRMAGFNTNGQAEVEVGLNPSIKTDCMTSNSNTNCTPLSDQMKNMPGFSELPDSFKNIASQSAKMADGLSGTNAVSGSTLSTAAGLASKQNAIAKLLGNTQKKLNERLLASGKSAIDFDKEQKKLLGEWNNETAKVLKAKGVSAGDFMASIGASPISGASKAATAGVEHSAKKTAYVPGAAGVAPGAVDKKDKAFDLDFKESAESNGALAGGAAGDGKEEKYDIGQNDINTNIDQSIFQMISDRYLKSGYPKLLEEEPIKNQSAQ